MRKALLLYNPLSGQRQERRASDIESALSTLRSSGIEASTAPTTAAGQATDQVRQAIADGYDAIFACGGDGTIHDVLQGLVGTQVGLGIIPLGTANSFAHDLKIPTEPSAAALAAVNSPPRRIAVGHIAYQDFNGKPASRYFAFIVGIGVDAHLFYKINAAAKKRFGMGAYCLKAFQLWLLHPKDPFAVEFLEGALSRRAEVSQFLAVRIGDFGGVLRDLAPGASLDRDDLRFVLFHTRSRIKYLRYILRGLFGTNWQVPGIELLHSTAAHCWTLDNAGSSQRVLIEADGELLGMLPAKITMLPDALTLLSPAS